MKKLWYCVICVLFMFGLTSCGKNDMPEISTNGVVISESSDPQATETIIRVPQWNPYKGNTIPQDGNILFPIDIIAGENGSVIIFDAEYIFLDDFADKYEFATTSGWRVNLSKMSIVGYLKSTGEMVLIPDCDNALVVCLHDRLSGEIRCLVRRDVLEEPNRRLEWDQFDVYIDDHLASNVETAEYVWQVHTDENMYETAIPVLDGEWQYCSISMVYKECPALQYELNYGVCDGWIYVERISTSQLVQVPLK